MKKSIFIFCLFLISQTALPQLSLSHSFDYSANITMINATTYKYFIMDVPNEECRIYNPDFSIYRTISVPIPDGEWLYDIRFVAEDLFNTDQNIELLYTYYKWITTNVNSGDGYYVYHSKLISETGSVLLDVPGALYSYIKETSPEEYSLFLYIYNLSVDPYTIKTNIYSIPGKLNSFDEAKKSSVLLNAFPNPADQYLDIEYILPQGTPMASLHIIDNSGREHSVYKVDGFSGKLRLQTNEFIPGIYYYYLENQGQKSEVKKVIME